MAENETRRFPRGQIALGSGDLQQAIVARFTFTNNGKLKHSLRRSPSGYVLGTRDCSGSFELEIDEDGPEIDVFDAIKSGEFKNFRYKMPKIVKTIEGILVSVDVELPIDDAVKFTVSWVGKLKDGS
jgi:hypothetical protein